MNQPLLFEMPGKDCLPGQMDLPMDDHAISAGELVNHAETIAPVSGCRCRVCGHNARRDAPSETWYVEHSTAYCWECWSEHNHVCDDNCRSNGCSHR